MSTCTIQGIETYTNATGSVTFPSSSHVLCTRSFDVVSCSASSLNVLIGIEIEDGFSARITCICKSRNRCPFLFDLTMCRNS